MEFKVIRNAVLNFLRDEEGASGIEYALVAAMVAIGIVTFVTPVREAIVAVFTQIQTELGSVGGDGT